MMTGPALDPAWTAALGAVAPGPLVSPWLAVPVGAVVIVILTVHMRSQAYADMPESRRRIRTVNDWLMLLATPVTVYAFSLATPADPRAFLLAWLSVAGLLVIILLVAGLDILNTGRINLGDRRELRGQLRAALRESAAPSPPSPDTPE